MIGKHFKAIGRRGFCVVCVSSVCSWKDRFDINLIDGETEEKSLRVTSINLLCLCFFLIEFREIISSKHILPEESMRFY